MTCGSRSTATASSPLPAKKRACRPCPLATSSTGPRVTSGAHRTTQSEGVSDPWESAGNFRPFPGQQPAQDRAMATLRALAVAADGKIRVARQFRQELNQALAVRRLHLAAIVARVLRP